MAISAVKFNAVNPFSNVKKQEQPVAQEETQVKGQALQVQAKAQTQTAAPVEEVDGAATQQAPVQEQPKVDVMAIMSIVKQMEIETDPAKKAELAQQAALMIDEAQAALAPADGTEAAAGNGHGKGKALGKNNRLEMLQRKQEEGKLSNGHQKQLDRLAQNGTDAQKMTMLDSLENKVNPFKPAAPAEAEEGAEGEEVAPAPAQDQNVAALDAMAAQNIQNLQVQQQQQAAQQPAVEAPEAEVPAEQAAADQPEQPAPLPTIKPPVDPALAA